MEASVRAERNHLFQELRQCCVELSQLTLRDDKDSKKSNAVINHLLDILQRKCQRKDGVFDEKLADYVFFPLSQLLRRKQTYRTSELTIKCLNILLEFGWRQAISLDLAKQLLILLTLLAEDANAPEELNNETFEALAALFRCLQAVAGGSSSIVEASTMPALGHAATVILDGIAQGSAVASLSALEAMWHCVKDLQALSTFLPATVSTLTKFLGRKAESRTKTTVLALRVLQRVLVSLLSDLKTRGMRDELVINPEPTNGKRETLSMIWLRATTAQIKLALSSVIRIRQSASQDVCEALNSFCLVLLDECHETLAQSAPMLVETAMMVAPIEGRISSSQTTLPILASIHPDISTLVRTTVYNWSTSLPRIMQSNDDSGKQVILAQLSNARVLLSGLAPESSILEETFLSSLRDSVTALLESSRPKNIQEAPSDTDSQAMTMFVNEHALANKFKPILLPHGSQKQTRDQLLGLLENLGTKDQQIRTASELLEYARTASGSSLISSYWLASSIFRAASEKDVDLNEFLDTSLVSSNEHWVFDQELFSYSVSILTRDEERHVDWRMQAIALEVIADTCHRAKEGFRTELIDILYPVTQLLGSPSQDLREHAITCLNLLSQSCGYLSSKEMIIENADYMVNALSLKLNTFNISPQAPRVLIMMIRLTGPSLLHYLDDVVDSIFAALGNFHGYQKLVEALFSVLSEVVEVGSKSPQLQIKSGQKLRHFKQSPSFPSVEDIVSSLKTQSHHFAALEGEEAFALHEEVPQRPWRNASSLLTDSANQSEAEPELEQSLGSSIQPPTKTHSLIHRITLLTQHHLTHASPLIRAKLLVLLSTSIPILSMHEDTFLPLINEIWPVLVLRFYDLEPYVAIAAAGVIAALCEGAGDFMSGRMEQDWASILRAMRKRKQEMEKDRNGAKGKGGRGDYAMSWRMWKAGRDMLCQVFQYVRITDEMSDDVFALLGDEMSSDNVKDVLNLLDGGDGVWFELFLKGEVHAKELRQPEGQEGRLFLKFE